MCAIYSVRPPSVLPANPPEPTLGRPTDASTQNANRSRFLSSVNTLCDNNAANGRAQRHYVVLYAVAPPHIPRRQHPILLVGSFGCQARPSRMKQAGHPFGLFGPSETALLVV